MPVPQSTEDEKPSSSWADRMDDLDGPDINPGNLPSPVVTITGDKKTVIQYVLEDEKIKKTTSVYRIERKRVPKQIAARKQWAKFGDASRDGNGPNSSTTQIADEIFLTLTTNIIDMDQQDDDPLKKLRDQQKGMVTCRLCKGDHWTSKCPFKDSLGVSAMKEMDETANAKQDAAAAAPMASGGGATTGPGGKYVPPNQRAGEGGRRGESLGGSRMSRDDDQFTVRVTNLSEEAQEGDLKELFSHFGQLKRTFLAKDKITQQSKGFAFVSFTCRDDAARAIENLDGHGYDHLILKVEWAKPSKQPGMS